MAIAERPPLRFKPCAPDAVFNLFHAVYSPEQNYPLSSECAGCGQTLVLQDIQLDWPVEGNIQFYLGRIPGFKCEPCGLAHFTKNTLGLIELCVRSGMSEFGMKSEVKRPDKVVLIP